MPSFDIVCSTDMQLVDNAINSARREIDNRYDFKGCNCTIEVKLQDNEITLLASDDYKLTEMHNIIKIHFTRQKIDAKAVEFLKSEPASQGMIRQTASVKQGIDKEIGKKIIKEIKSNKLKVQPSIRGEELRIDGKKRDDLQQVMQFVKEMNLDIPVNFENFRD
jgi:uncharacterized protein YajQ (UPF0234 family)